MLGNRLTQPSHPSRPWNNKRTKMAALVGAERQRGPSVTEAKTEFPHIHMHT